ncbi:MAG: hypothetical protein ACD_39C02122G0006, partial [uncultured bacterium]
IVSKIFQSFAGHSKIFYLEFLCYIQTSALVGEVMRLFVLFLFTMSCYLWLFKDTAEAWKTLKTAFLKRWKSILRWMELLLYGILSILLFEMFSADLRALWVIAGKRILRIDYPYSLSLPVLLLIFLCWLLSKNRPSYSIKNFIKIPPLEIPIVVGFWWVVWRNVRANSFPGLAYVIVPTLFCFIVAELYKRKFRERYTSASNPISNWLISETPIDSIEEDKFGFLPIVDQFKSKILAGVSSIGVYGAHGSGKSSLINLGKAELRNEGSEKFLFCNLDIWGFQEGSLVQNTLSKIVDVLSEKVDCSGLKSLPQEYISLISTGSFSFLESLNKVWGNNGSADQILERLESLLILLETKLVVVVEDLDRNFFSGEKLAEFSGLLDRLRSKESFVIVIAIDPTLVEKELHLDRLIETTLFLPSLSGIDGVKELCESIDSFSEVVAENDIELPEKRKLKSLEEVFFFTAEKKAKELSWIGPEFYSDELYKEVRKQNTEVDGFDLEVCFSLFFNRPRILKKILRTFQFYYEKLYRDIDSYKLFLIIAIKEISPELFSFMANNFDSIPTVLHYYQDKDSNTTDYIKTRDSYSKELAILDESLAKFKKNEAEHLLEIISHLMTVENVRYPNTWPAEKFNLKRYELEAVIKACPTDEQVVNQRVLKLLHSFKVGQENEFFESLFREEKFFEGFMAQKKVLSCNDWEKLLKKLFFSLCKGKGKDAFLPYHRWDIKDDLIRKKVNSDAICLELLPVVLKNSLSLSVALLSLLLMPERNSSAPKDIFQTLRDIFQQSDWELENVLPARQLGVLREFVRTLEAKVLLQDGMCPFFVGEKILRTNEDLSDRMVWEISLLLYTPPASDARVSPRKYFSYAFDKPKVSDLKRICEVQFPSNDEFEIPLEFESWSMRIADSKKIAAAWLEELEENEN